MNSHAQQYWDTFGWSASGCAGAVSAIAKADDGSYYLGGLFAACGDTEARNVVRWIPSENRFEALSQGAIKGIDGVIYDIEITADSVYVAGATTFLPRTRTLFARYDRVAKQWSEPGSFSDINNNGIVALHVHDGYLYAGGGFSHVDGMQVDGLARYRLDNGTWSSLGLAPDRWVGAIQSIGSVVYVGGLFSSVDGTAVNNLAAYDTVGGQWGAVPATGPNGVFGPSGSSGIVYTLAANSGTLFVGGDFGTAGAVASADVARFDSSTGQWAAMATSPVVESHRVVDLSADAEAVHAVVVEASTNGSSAAFLASYSLQTTTWNIDPDVLTFDGGRIHSDGSRLMFSGFSAVPGVEFNGIASKDPVSGQWEALGVGIAGSANSSITGLTAMGRRMFAVGVFTQIGGISSGNVAELNCDTGEWAAVAPEGQTTVVDGFIRGVAANETDLYVGGGFSSLNGQPINSVARFNFQTRQWFALGSGVDNGVAGLAAILQLTDDSLYVSGQFASAGGQPAANIARFSLSEQTWHPLGAAGADGIMGSAHAMALSGDDLYVGGFFSAAGGEPASSLARYDTARLQWVPLAQGTSPSIYGLGVSGSSLYAAGDFFEAGGLPSDGLATYDLATGQWQNISTNRDQFDFYQSLLPTEQGFFLGGQFPQVAGVTTNSLVRYEAQTQQFYPLDDGLQASNGDQGFVQAQAICSGRLWVGGSFSYAGGGLSNNIAAYRLDTLLEAGFE
ncbi:MAG: hypothetical protein KDI71_03005 [Xanthomonadales bacterium]|nr:hypothetical protein [Xanthomonadales bacterium]